MSIARDLPHRNLLHGPINRRKESLGFVGARHGCRLVRRGGDADVVARSGVRRIDKRAEAGIKSSDKGRVAQG
jgi:hypothetical protein